jgi:hypothetical protein
LNVQPSFPVPDLPPAFAAWFDSKGWRPRAHQLALLARADAKRDALLIAPTGAGKTLAGFLPSLVDLAGKTSEGRSNRPGGLHTLYISPLKALAVDVARNLTTPAEEMGLPIRIETRTGDTPPARRQRQKRNPPDILLTTPEQLALLLSHVDAERMFGGVKRVIFDELHALVTSKRGDLLALGLAQAAQACARSCGDGPLGNGRRPGRPGRVAFAAKWHRGWRGGRHRDRGRRRATRYQHSGERGTSALGRAHGALCVPRSAASHRCPPHHTGVRQHARASGACVPGAVVAQ